MMELLHNVCTSTVGGINDSPSLSKTTEIQCLGLLEPVADGDFHQRTGKKGRRSRGEEEQTADAISTETSIYLVHDGCLCF